MALGVLLISLMVAFFAAGLTLVLGFSLAIAGLVYSCIGTLSFLFVASTVVFYPILSAGKRDRPTDKPTDKTTCQSYCLVLPGTSSLSRSFGSR